MSCSFKLVDVPFPNVLFMGAPIKVIIICNYYGNNQNAVMLMMHRESP